MLWLTGANRARSIGRDLGYDVSADSASSLSHLAAGASYQSRHYLTFDVGSILGVRTAIVYDHNSDTGGTYTVQAAAAAADVLDDPAYTAALDDNTDYLATFRAAIFAAEQSYRYWAVVIDDVANADGFVEIGLVYLGSWLEIDYRGRGMDRSPIDFSAVAFSDQGVAFQDRKQATRAWDLKLEAQTLTVADDLDEIFQEILTGGCFFLIPEPDRTPLRVLYGFLPSAPKIEEAAGGVDIWMIGLRFQEALG